MTESEYITLSEGNETLRKKILRPGTGKTPPNRSEVHVHYTGRLMDGTQFDSSRDRDQVFTFKLGQGMVIRGWDEGIKTMQVGELAELICPPDFAYGSHGSPPTIPPNATLKFEVELLDFDEPADTPLQRLAIATTHKEKGNDLFKSGQYGDAMSTYLKALKLLDPKEMQIQTGTQSESLEGQVQALTVSLRSNMAACQLKLGELSQAIANCEMVLEVDPQNVKAYFRLGQALHITGEYDQARLALKKAAGLAPTDAGIRKELQLVELRQKAYLEKEKQAFGKLFQQ